MKGLEEFRHDLFKAEVSKFKKNLSWKKGEVRIDLVEHVHHFHSRNSAGKQQLYTNSVGNHFHKVTLQEVDGQLIAKCGPPLRKVLVGPPGRQKSVIQRVSWLGWDDLNNKDKEYIDDHVHEMTYMHSEILSPSKIKRIQSQTARALEQMLPEGAA